jgi:UDP-glucose 4-epimerase
LQDALNGAASFIGSHLVDALIERGAAVRIVDNLSSGALKDVRPHAKPHKSSSPEQTSLIQCE